MSNLRLKDFLIEYYAKKDEEDPCKKIKDKKKKEECQKIQDHKEIVDFITNATATNN